MADEIPNVRPLAEWFALTIECPDADALAAFYADAMGGAITRRRPDWVLMQAPGLAMNFHSTPDYTPTTWPSWEVPMHHHFELVVDDPEHAARMLIGSPPRP